MLNYLRSELFRSVHRRGIRVFLGLCLGVLVLIALIVLGNDATSTDYLQVIFQLASVGGLILFPSVFSSLNRKEKGIHVQMVSFGLNRLKIFVGDFILIALQMLLAAFLLGLCALGLAQLLPQGGAEWAASSSALALFSALGRLYLCVLPLLALSQALSYFFQNTGVAVSLYFVLAFLLPQILTNFAFKPWVDFLVKFFPFYYTINLSLSAYAFDVQWLGICILTNLAVWLCAAGVTYWRKEI